MATLLNPAAATFATAPLAYMANQNMRGMQPATAVIAGQFTQGQRLEQPFQMLPQKCYGAIAAAVGIQDVHIQFILQQPIPGINNPVLAEDKAKGANAVLGGGGGCYRWQFPFGVNVKAVFTAAAGQGMAAGRVYVK